MVKFNEFVRTVPELGVIVIINISPVGGVTDGFILIRLVVVDDTPAMGNDVRPKEKVI